MALISFINILTVVVGLVVILPAQLDAYYTQNTGCHHNGSWYADKSLVPTTEKCLNCQCLKKILVCRLKVCPEMPMPPPRGCVVVQKKNTCCPYLSCARLDAFYKIPATRRIIAYLDHYERESIDRVVNENMLQRRSDDNDVDLYVCVKNGTVYKSGSAMSSSNLCSYCYCIGGTEKCVKPKCMLPVEGCKPIFVDSTCCPVRYDCSTKQTGKSSQEVRYRKTSNKHYMRMSQRLQRNRGCIVGEKFYAEGQKMKTDKDKPCDICFCIRGQRKCAPKKCAPALRNCIPVVPKGHCCPSSYDCGSQRDYRRSQNSRQFNLFSLLFGKDEDPEENAATEISVEYPHDREPPHSEPATGPSTEKSMYDTIREGLEFIDNNNNQMLKDNMDLVNIVKDSQHNQHPQQHQPSPTPIPLKMMQQMPSTTEVSFFDLLLGPSDPNAHKDSSEELEEESIEEKTTPTSSSLSWVDLLLGPNEDDMKTSASTISDKIDKTDTTRLQDHTDFDSTTTIDRLDHDLYTSSEESLGELPAEQQDEQWTSTTDATNTAESMATDDTTQTLPTTLAETTEEIKATEPFEQEAVTTTMKPTRKLATTTTVKPKSKLSSSTQKPLQSEDFQKNENLPTIKLEIPSKTTPPPKPEKNSDFLAAFWDGLSDILEGENKTRHTTNELPSKSTTPKPLPVFKPLPLDKTYTRINSKIANLTIKTPFLNTKDYMNTTFKPMPVHPSKNPMIPLTETLQNPPKPAKPTTSTTTSTTTTTTAKPSVAPSLKPLMLETNPTILEAESLEENSEHTLPPSLPNLKIIPFLPADAVEADHNQPSSYDFYHHSSGPISRVDYDLYDDANVYPSITEKYPLYPDLEDGSKAEYIYKFNVEGPDSTVSSPAGKFDGTLGSPAFVKYDFTGSGLPPAIKGFSPPTKTEGGFMPKEPLNLDVDDSENVSVNVGDSYKLTEHLIDITTSGDIMNTTKIIEITTPDPFKDVIRTELPPDLTSLIEDKLKNFNMQSNKTITKTKTATSQPYDKPQTRPNIELHTKQAEPNQMNSKITKTQFKMTHVQDSNNNGNKSKHNGEQEDIKQSKVNLYDMGNDDDDDDDVVDNDAANDVSTIPPFKTLPQAVVKQFDKENTTKAMLAMEQISTMKLKQNQTTLTPTNKTKITKTIITTSTRRPTTTKTNRTKTIATNSSNRTKQQQKLTKTKTSTSASSGNSETRVLASSSSSSSSSSAGTVSTLKTKSNATRRVTSPKPTKHYKPTNRPTTTTTTTTTTQATTPTPTRTTKSTSKPNAINIDITSAATRRTTKPTMAYNNPTRASKPKISTTTTQTTASTTTKQTTSAKPTSTTTMRTTSLSTSLKTTTNPFFMSPFDKLPFMDASFEVKRNSATPPSFTSSKQHFAVAANVPAAAAATMLENAGDNDEHDDENDGDGSSMHNLMGLVHYKHKLNQLEGLEPSTQRPQHSSASASFSSFSEQSSASSSSSSSQQHHSSPSSSLNNLIDPTGILKLAGCNIYGRMYRVGRIILELSSPCLECKCTEIGVKCGPLEC